jgi:hypothetical protein
MIRGTRTTSTPPKAPRNTDHHLTVIKTDVLLWCLGAFAEVPAPKHTPRGIPLGMIRELQALAKLPKPLPFGTFVPLSERYGRSIQTLSSEVYRIRAGTLWADAV